MIGLIAPITSLSLTGAFRRVKFRIWSLNLSTDLARGIAYKSSGLALVVRLWAAIRSPLPRLILYPRNSNPSLMRISRKEGQRFTACRSTVSHQVGPVLVRQDVVDFHSVTYAGQALDGYRRARARAH